MNYQNELYQTKSEMKILTDFKLWNLLLKDSVPTGHRKLSKAEAFYDLLNRQRLAALYDQDALWGNFQTLAVNWNWHRQTVKKFLSELEALGAISIDQSVNRTVMRVSNVIIIMPDMVSDTQNSQGSIPSLSEKPP